MTIKEMLMDELKRLNRLNDKLEKEINTGNVMREPEQKIVKNVIAMCKIAETIKLI